MELLLIVGAARVTISECKLSDNRATDDGGVLLLLYALDGTANLVWYSIITVQVKILDQI